MCPICSSAPEDSSHLFFGCCLVTDVVRLVCRWWNLDWSPVGSYSDWLAWFNSVRLSSNVKGLLEGVFYISWWSVWQYRNQLLFSTKIPRKDVTFDDVVSRSYTWCHSSIVGFMIEVDLNMVRQKPQDSRHIRARYILILLMFLPIMICPREDGYIGWVFKY
ncbi:hypothetical protein CTI12_AA454090 [Artemisia annua]|uniref:RNA-directed DNA polymerase, eukaryota n=1 Tax=Artemisia annua TaxID=35608 RepID=A0A2U1LTX1_ARTAN|nr:hypothetical protein CTI12_AA454090 [Artemisia annua]